MWYHLIPSAHLASVSPCHPVIYLAFLSRANLLLFLIEYRLWGSCSVSGWLSKSSAYVWLLLPVNTSHHRSRAQRIWRVLWIQTSGKFIVRDRIAIGCPQKSHGVWWCPVGITDIPSGKGVLLCCSESQRDCPRRLSSCPPFLWRGCSSLDDGHLWTHWQGSRLW